ncbi:NAD(P)-dependent oxidoreductase [Microbispora sp. RL4-1S]|uniref:NAD(P)-dependent oxidoreductase n=1 Tax=Microbispora oryzae TaxID=2806554 RepID=A0A940WRM9_9ACTN|nr:NAD(P)-dependent oxidoreductase [Microbispora oryzae]MBP2706200.1 NAD(P)-dependent oxidoreductase [Microbispora oryzae]
MRVAVLGMGQMGRALARRLLRNEYAVTVWNRTPGRAGEVLDEGGVEASAPEEAAAGKDAVVLSLSDDAAVRAVMERLTGMEPGPIVVDTSTVSPGTSRALRELAPGHRFVAAPIAGGPAALLEGKATTLIGGAEALVSRLEPIWADLYDAATYCGEDPGHASAFKLLNNYLLMSGLAVLAEVVVTAQGAGLDESLTRDLLSRSPLVAPGLRNRLDDLISGDHRGWFTTRLGAKDLRLARELAEESGVAAPLVRVMEGRYDEAAARGWDGHDIAAVIELLRE